MQAAYALYFFVRIASLPTGKSLPYNQRQPVSIIICAKNEAANLRKNLSSVLAQRYDNDMGSPLYEVIVVNDASDDDTAEALMELEMQYDNLWDVAVSKNEARNLPGKKYALSRGVSIAQHQWLVLIDADCAPASDTWLENLVAPLAEGKDIVAGYGGYNAGSGLLNSFIRWETLHTFLQYSTYAAAGKPYMAVGRNMACTRGVLLRAQQSPVWGALPSGDDDLLVSIAGTAHNTAVVCDKQAFTYTSAKATWSEWVRQKQRHLSTGKYYKPGIKLLLGLYGVAHAGLWLSFFVLLSTPCSMPAIKVMAVRCLLYWGLWIVTAIKLREQKLIYLFPVFDIAWLVYNFVFFPYITWKDKRKWI